jgi:hypothetical protein
LNIVKKTMDAKSELRKAEKTLQNFEMLSEDLNAVIALLHEPGLKRALPT